MVLHVVHALEKVQPSQTVVVVGHEADRVSQQVQGQAPDWANVRFVEQVTRRGTGDAAARSAGQRQTICGSGSSRIPKRPYTLSWMERASVTTSAPLAQPRLTSTSRPSSSCNGVSTS